MNRITYRVAAFVMGLGDLAHSCPALAVLTGGTAYRVPVPIFVGQLPTWSKWPTPNSNGEGGALI